MHFAPSLHFALLFIIFFAESGVLEPETLNTKNEDRYLQWTFPPLLVPLLLVQQIACKKSKCSIHVVRCYYIQILEKKQEFSLILIHKHFSFFSLKRNKNHSIVWSFDFLGKNPLVTSVGLSGNNLKKACVGSLKVFVGGLCFAYFATTIH